MMSLLWSLTFLAIAIVVDFILKIVFRRIRKGRFQIREASARAFSFDTNFGSFRINREAARLTMSLKHGPQSLPLSDVTTLRYRHDGKWAALSEWFFGFELTDLLNRYRDRVHWYTIWLRTAGGQEIPVFAAGQYEPREFLMDWYVALQASVLTRLGLFTDIEDYCRPILDRVLAEFRSAGARIDLR